MWLLHVLYLFYTDLCVCVLSDCVCSAVILGMPCDFGLSRRKHAATRKLVCVCCLVILFPSPPRLQVCS